MAKRGPKPIPVIDRIKALSTPTPDKKHWLWKATSAFSQSKTKPRWYQRENRTYFSPPFSVPPMPRMMHKGRSVHPVRAFYDFDPVYYRLAKKPSCNLNHCVNPECWEVVRCQTVKPIW